MERTCHPRADEEGLVTRCLNGEHLAWDILFRRYHPRLVTIIRSLMRNGSGPEQAEEIAATIWFSLCSQEFARLRRYNPLAGGLLGYLASLARREIWSRRRSERSRLTRESRAARDEATWDELDDRLNIQDFLTTLTRREREFFLAELTQQPRIANEPPGSAANGWQLRCRVLKKFRMYFFTEDSP